jgi:hypothetical protein
MNETWMSRDLPVLDAVVELLESRPMAQPAVIAERTGFAEAEVVRALRALDGEYVRLNNGPGRQVRSRRDGQSAPAGRAVADSEVLLVSSANLTQSGIGKNIEAGLLVRG